MGRFTKRVLVGFTAALVAAGGAFAQYTVDNLEHGGNQNRVGQYWYYFVGDEYNLLESKAEANHQAIIKNAGAGDEHGLMSFEAFPRTSLPSGLGGDASKLGNYVAAMNFDNWLDIITVEGGYVILDHVEAAYPVIGMGTLLTDDDDRGFGADFEKVQSISFDMLAPDGANIIFKVETIENSPTNPTYGPDLGCTPTDDEGKKPLKKGCNPSNAYMKMLVGTGDWETYTVSIAGIEPPAVPDGTPLSSATNTKRGKAGDLKQDQWWGRHFTFNPANVTKLAWQVNGDKNEELNTGLVAVDNIKLHGPGVDENFFVPANVCRDCIGGLLPTVNKLVGDFDNSDNDSYRQNEFGGYWYHYDDDEAGGGAWINPTDGTHMVCDTYAEEITGDCWVMAVDGKGYNNTNGAFIEFAIDDPTFTHNKTGMSIASFVGIGTNLYDANNRPFSYVNVRESQGIFFRFKASGALVGNYLTVEIADEKDVIQAETPEGDDGQVWHTMLLVEDTEWLTVAIDFDKLSLPLWIKQGDRRYGVPLDKTKIAKIQFKYAGAGAGTLQIDDLYFYGDAMSVKAVGSKAKAAGLRASYSRGNVSVNWNAAQQIAGGKIQLVNTKGRVISSAPIAKNAGSRITANLGKGTIPSGMYFVRIDARDVNGKRIVQQAPITVVR